MSNDIRTTYRRAGMNGTLRLGVRPVILVVDLSRGFTDPTCSLGGDMDEVVAATVRLVRAARTRQVPVVFTTIAYTAAATDAGVWIQKIPTLADLKVGSKWTEIDPRLQVQPDDVVITKRFASAFFGTHLATVLATLKADTLVLTGATTSGCVRASAVDALQHGYPTLIPRECVGDRAPEPHEANLFDMGAKYADVVLLDDVLSYLHSLPGTRPVSQG